MINLLCTLQGRPKILPRELRLIMIICSTPCGLPIFVADWQTYSQAMFSSSASKWMVVNLRRETEHCNGVISYDSPFLLLGNRALKETLQFEVYVN